MNIEQDEPESDAVDKKILDSIDKSQERWFKGVQSILARRSKAQLFGRNSPEGSRRYQRALSSGFIQVL